MFPPPNSSRWLTLYEDLVLSAVFSIWLYNEVSVLWKKLRPKMKRVVRNAKRKWRAVAFLR